MNDAPTPIIYDDRYYIAQANTLIRSRQDALSINEFRIIQLALSNIKQYDTELHSYSIKITELGKYLGIGTENIYRSVREIGERLKTRGIYFDKGTKDRKGNPNYKIIPWLSVWDYENGVITIQLNPALNEYLIGLTAFTRYQNGQIQRLENWAAGRLFQVLFSYVWRKFAGNENQADIYYGHKVMMDEVIIPIEDLKGYLDCSEKYPQTHDFIHRVIEPAVKQINEKALFPVGWKPIKEGRKIKYLLFKLDDWSVNNIYEAIEKKEQPQDDFDRSLTALPGQIDIFEGE